ncbi:hypothetical protein [Legionella parisiensis]|uniref:Chromosome partition protein Smc n=1 Tax=Legionella parisiensis TaxID=45071 RepID=A0A1E5JR53_9GAMM|nr:hypothetical protein [Legionella parisiensis]KTD40663.1 Chromosome partition protein Smc [Legionella parisiensis]OEH46985.1 Chromosome partition protein Smc [Legionella parisiensis]STX76888.1 ATPase involved in DNA repair [Legionella parisiensis]
MPSLNANELSQWTDGDADLLSKLLLYLFLFMRTATNNGKDTNFAYERVEANIRNFISVRGDDRLHIPVLNRASVDASALLGAYLRQDIVLKGKPIVELSDEQIQVVHNFVKPLIPEGFTPKIFFDGLEGSPAQKHVTILKLLIFKGVSTEDQKGMFKPKYAENVDALLDSVLKLVEFMRTPFKVLDLEEIASKALAKQLGKEQASTSGIDLQWASLYNAINRCLEDIITLKKGKIGKAGEFLEQIHEFLGTCQKCFGVANAGYKVKKEILVEIQKRDEELSETFKALGFPEGNPVKITHYITAFRESLVQREPEKAEAIKAMTLTQLINTYAAQWQAALDKIKNELASSKQELQKTKDTLHQQESALAQSDKQLKSVQRQYEALKLESDKTSRTLEKQHLELERLKQVESTSKETIKKLKEEIEKTRIDAQQNSSNLVKLEKEVSAVKRENEELKIQLVSAKKHEQTVLELRRRLEALQRENILLKQQLQVEKQTPKSSGEATSEVSELRFQLESMQPRDIGKHAKGSSTNDTLEVTQLRSQLESIQKENIQLKEVLRQTQPMSREQRVLPGLSTIKADLLIALGALRLNRSDMIGIKDKIIKSKEGEQLLEIDTEIKRLQKINMFIENINKGILERAGFFSSDPHKKTKAIETAFQELSVDDKYKIATLSEESINEELNKNRGEESDIGKLLKAIHHKRGFIPIHQATSFTFFKNGIGHLKQDLEKINVPKVL